MKYLSVLVALSLLLSACATNPAEDPLQIKLNDIDTRLGSVERVVSNQSLVDMSRRLDALEAQLREQRGSLEVLQNGSESERKQQRDLYADLDKRIAVLEGRLKAAAASIDATAVGPAEQGASTDAGPPGDDQAAYNHAFDTLKSGNYGEAVKAFKAFMSDYPASALLDNAQYWIGEAYYVTRDYEHAAQAFRTVGERWPSSRKAPDALLKLGYTQFEQKHLAETRDTLHAVVKRFPGSEAARLAQERLQRLPPEAR
ncbi:MAG TPA: tol-pal system protein YbgF [Steroidobacteraceae bacterium]|nr:tol-pal system protein YbgF [Steroidobacteraceae bacterium]